MHHKGDPFTYIKRFKQCIQVAAMLDEGVGIGAAVGKLIRIAHADEIRRDAAAKLLHIGNNVAPEVGGGGIAMQQDNRIATSYLYVRHLLSQNQLTLFLIGKCCANHARILPFLFVTIQVSISSRPRRGQREREAQLPLASTARKKT